jgi:hypothetical protein
MQEPAAPTLLMRGVRCPTRQRLDNPPECRVTHASTAPNRLKCVLTQARRAHQPSPN